MKCDQCDNPATVHEWTKAGGQRHLCEACAAKAGLPVQSQSQFTQIIAQGIASLLKPAPEAGKAGPGAESAGPASGAPGVDPKPLAACPSCGMELAQFRTTGLLGCPECYRAFESVLAPLIERAHEGSTHHTGKSPREGARAGTAADPGAASAAAEPAAADARLAAHRAERRKRIEVLRRQLAVAVQAEQYEKAAALRDEISRAEGEIGVIDIPPGAGPSPDAGLDGGDA